MTTEPKDRRLARQLAEEWRKEIEALDVKQYDFGDIIITVARDLRQKPLHK